ncbi:MAG TPA: lysophospholipid acyltransferase family protein [Bacteroidales bacterium]|nr:lysophospholipid acyltransferase family protein [Bacteroidales bacterium]
MIKPTLKNILVPLKALVSLLIFIITTQFFTLLILVPFSNKKRSAATFYTKLLTFYARFIIKTHFNIKVKHLNKPEQLFQHPALVVCNHQSIIDVPVSLSLTPKMRVLNNNWHDNAGAKFFITKYIGFFSIYQDLDILVKKLEPSVKMGCPLLVFPEGIMNYGQQIKRFHKGGFYIARNLDLDVQPVVIYYSENVLRRRWFYMKNGDVVVKFLDPIKVNSPLYGETYQELTHNVMCEMRNEYAAIKAAYESGSL